MIAILSKIKLLLADISKLQQIKWSLIIILLNETIIHILEKKDIRSIRKIHKNKLQLELVFVIIKFD